MFTESEFELLMEALDALETKDYNEAFTSGLFFGILTDGEPEEKAEKMMQDLEKAKEKGKRIETRIILLKAKLIQMQDENLVSEMKKYAEGG